MSPLHDNPLCFCCGVDNPHGFGMTIAPDGDALVGRASFDHRHEGSRGNLHGGATLAVVDEILGDLTTHLGHPALTASVNVEFRAPVALPAEAELRAWCERHEGRKLHLRVEMHVRGVLVAEGRGLMIEPRPA
jgi:acyl-coenzyme A thioesterase PaaI-like protein